MYRKYRNQAIMGLVTHYTQHHVFYLMHHHVFSLHASTFEKIITQNRHIDLSTGFQSFFLCLYELQSARPSHYMPYNSVMMFL